MGKTIAIITSSVLFALIGLLAVYLAKDLEKLGADEAAVARLAAPAIGAGIGLVIGILSVVLARRL